MTMGKIELCDVTALFGVVECPEQLHSNLRDKSSGVLENGIYTQIFSNLSTTEVYQLID